MPVCLRLKNEVFLLITDKYGNTQTEIDFYGGSYNDDGYSIQNVPEDDGFIICGSYQFSENGQKDIYVIRTDKFGDTL